MDEVDGMSAGDRGGAAEMAKLIKNSKVIQGYLMYKVSVFRVIIFTFFYYRYLSFVSAMI
jgi:hypothetical protein